MRQSAKILVDSSIWIDFFRLGNYERLETYIREDLVCTNELILTQLLPPLEKLKQTDVINSLHAIPLVELDIDWSLIRKYQALNISNGVNKVGIPDLIIVQQVIENNLTLLSKDKHFGLMQHYLSFDLIG